MADCSNTPTPESTANFDLDSRCFSEAMTSNADYTTSTASDGNVKKTYSAALRDAGWVNAGEWSTNPTATKSNEYFSYAGTNQRFRPLSLPYDVDSAAHPDPNALLPNPATGYAGELRDVSEYVDKSSVNEIIAESTISTIADLRLREPKYNKEVVTLIGHTLENFGGGKFYYKHSDSVSADNDGTVIVTPSGARWVRCGSKDGDVLTSWFGVGASDDDSTAINSALSWAAGRKVVSCTPTNRNITTGSMVVVKSGTEFVPDERGQVWDFKAGSTYFDMISNESRDKDSSSRDSNIKIGAFHLKGGLRASEADNIGTGSLSPYAQFNGTAGVRMANVDGYEWDGLECEGFGYGGESKCCTNGTRKNLNFHDNGDDGDSVSDGDWVGSSDNIVTKDSQANNNGFSYWQSGNSGFECDDGPDNVFYKRCTAEGNKGRGFDIHIHDGIGKTMVNIVYEECHAKANNRPAGFGSTRVRSTGFSIDHVDTAEGLVNASYIKCSSSGHDLQPVQFAVGNLPWEPTNPSSARKITTVDCIFDSSGSDFSETIIRPVVQISGVDSYTDFGSRFIGDVSNGNNMGLQFYLCEDVELNNTEFFACGAVISGQGEISKDAAFSNVYSKLTLNNVRTRSNIKYKQTAELTDAISLANINTVEINGGEFNKNRGDMRHWIGVNQSTAVKRLKINKSAQFAINDDGSSGSPKYIASLGGCNVLSVQDSSMLSPGSTDALINPFQCNNVVVTLCELSSGRTVSAQPALVKDIIKDNYDG